MASINERNLKLGKDNQFQLILVGLDDSKPGNENYIRKSKINFPGIKVAGLKLIADRLKIETRAAPRIALLKPGGEVVSNDDLKIINLLNELAPATKKRNSVPDKPAPKTYHAGEPGDFAKQQTFTNGVGMKMIRVPASSRPTAIPS